MSSPTQTPLPARKPVLSLDLWAVVLSLGLALLVKLGVIHNIGW